MSQISDDIKNKIRALAEIGSVNELFHCLDILETQHQQPLLAKALKNYANQYNMDAILKIIAEL